MGGENILFDCFGKEVKCQAEIYPVFSVCPFCNQCCSFTVKVRFLLLISSHCSRIHFYTSLEGVPRNVDAATSLCPHKAFQKLTFFCRGSRAWQWLCGGRLRLLAVHVCYSVSLLPSCVSLVPLYLW